MGYAGTVLLVGIVVGALMLVTSGQGSRCEPCPGGRRNAKCCLREGKCCEEIQPVDCNNCDVNGWDKKMCCLLQQKCCPGGRDCNNCTGEPKHDRFCCRQQGKCCPEPPDCNNCTGERTHDRLCCRLQEKCCPEPPDCNNCTGESKDDRLCCRLEGKCCNEEDCGQWRCNSGQFIERKNVCNGETDCDDQSDENPTWCKTWRCCPDWFKCENPPACIPRTKVCDGEKDCRDGTDEMTCN